MAQIVINSGPDRGKTFPIGDTQVIGRLGKSTIAIRDSRASREHARVYRSGGAFHLVDLNSKNGTLLNGEKVSRAQLSPGDEIQIGETFLLVEFGPEDLEPTAPKGPAAAPAAGPGKGAEDVVLRSRSGPLASTEAARRTTRGSARTREAAVTRTSLAWLRTDLTQVSILYKVLVLLGILAIAGGLFYLSFRVTR